MKTIILYSSLLMLIVTGSACKKAKQEPEPTPVVSHGGELMVNQYFLIDHDTVQSKDDLDAVAHFTGPNVIDYVSVDAVSMNGTPLLTGSAGIAGYYQAPVKPALVWNWHVKGNNGIPDFDHTYTTALPSFTEFASLPDDIDKTQNFVISLKSLSNATSASIQIHGGSNPVFKTFSILPGTPSIQIPASELTGLTQTDALVEIGFENETGHQVNDRIFLFQNSILISKRMKIK